MAKVLYTAEATVTGGRAEGHGVSTDGVLDVALRMPPELGGEGGGTNPEQLFAVGFAACFEGALGVVGRREKLEVGNVSIDSRVTLTPTRRGRVPAWRRARRHAVERRRRCEGRRGGRGCAPGVPLFERDPRQHRRQADGERAAGRLRPGALRRARPRPPRAARRRASKDPRRGGRTARRAGSRAGARPSRRRVSRPPGAPVPDR
jgi:organic hydroperoxide reductase OsmC/OhrA